MKKFITLLIFSMSALISFSQYYEEISIDAIVDGKIHLCADDENLLGVIIHGELDCPNQTWEWYYNYPAYEEIHADSIVIFNDHEEQCTMVRYRGCNIDLTEFRVSFAHILQYEQPVNNPIIWKRSYEPVTLYNPWDSDPCWMSWGLYLWSTGENTGYIEVTTPGVYSVTLNHPCTAATYSVEVRDNVELYRATVDLRTNKNKVTWLATPEQAEYITEVKVYRDGNLVGTVPYANGYFLDAIGSDAAARTYQIVGVSVEGEDCPIASYEKGTIHTTYYEDVNGNLNMTWNIPYVEEGAQGTLTYFQICKYDPNTGEITVVDQVNSSITDYTCGVNQFDGGYAVIAAVFNDGKGVEELSFSNLTTDILGIEEDGLSTGLGTFTVYPNPAKDRVTIEGTGKAIITNALGQTILTKEIDGKETIELPQGMYFVKMNGVTRKIVVV